jgi:4,5-dihydroxyphthalate decarboxylase
MQYDTTRALFDGTVSFRGFETEMRTAQIVPEIFQRMMSDREFDVSELGLTFYLRGLERQPDDDPPYLAIPAFPNRVFRHSCIYVNASSGIESPADLVGRTIGEFGVYGQDSGVWAKGILMDEYGFRPEANRWVIGGLDHPMPPFDFVPQPHPADVQVDAAPENKSLSEMLESGEIDVLFTANVPQCVLDGSTKVRRLFPNHEPLERDYHQRTGIFPIMHAVVVSREALDAHSTLARAAYDAFLQSKNVAADRYLESRRLYNVHTMVPWMNALVERTQTEFGQDWWPYGVEANRAALETNLRYQYEQGLTRRHWKVDEIFYPL